MSFSNSLALGQHTILMPAVQFADVYSDLVEVLWDKSPEHTAVEMNERTGVEVSALLGATSFKLDLSNGEVPMPGWRRFHIKSAAAEVAWFFNGKRDIDWLRKYAPLWNKFVENDGQTIYAAYGYRWRHQFGRDQMASALGALYTNKSDRRVYVSNWDPSYDGLGAPNQKSVPCPLGFTLSVVGGKLHSTLTIRSSDVFVGLPYDVAGHAMVMGVVAHTLKVDLGTMTVTLAHPHLYSVHYDMAEEMLQQEPIYDQPKIVDWIWLDMTDGHDPADGFVEAYLEAMENIPRHPFNPIPEVVE